MDEPLIGSPPDAGGADAARAAATAHAAAAAGAPPCGDGQAEQAGGRRHSAASREIRDASTADKVAAALNLTRYLVTTAFLIYLNVGPGPDCHAPHCPEGRGRERNIERAQYALAVGTLVVEALLFRYCCSRRRHFPGSHYQNVHTLAYGKVLSMEYPGDEMGPRVKFMMGCSGYFALATCLLATRKLEAILPRRGDEGGGGRDGFSAARFAAAAAVLLSSYKAVLSIVLYAAFYANVWLLLMRVVLSVPVYAVCLLAARCTGGGDAAALMRRRADFAIPRLSSRRGDWLFPVFAFIYKDLSRTVPFEEGLIACVAGRRAARSRTRPDRPEVQFGAPPVPVPPPYAPHHPHQFSFHPIGQGYHPPPAR